MPDAPKNPRRAAFLAILSLVDAGLVWRAGRPQGPVESVPATPPPISGAVTADATSGAAARAPESSEASEERPGPAKREGVDAANIYANAFVLFDQLTDEEKAMLRKPSEEVDADQAAKLFEKIQAIMALLRAAAKADYCDWGTGEITFETGLPHIGMAQDLAKLALWAAAYRFPTDPAGAIDDLSARARLGHHLTETLIGALAAGSIETTAHKLLGDHLGRLDSAATGKALEFLHSSTLDADLSHAFRGETSGVESFAAKLARVDARERGRMLLEIQGGGTESRNWLDPVKEFTAGVIANPESIATELAFIRGVHAKAPDALRMSEEDFQSWWRDVESTLKTDHPLARLTMPALDGIQKVVQRLRIERELLTAGADVLQHGPSQVGRYRDPATGGALLYVPTPTGFELRSPYVVKGKPVTMAFTRP